MIGTNYPNGDGIFMVELRPIYPLRLKAEIEQLLREGGRMTTIVDGHPDGSLVKTNIEQETYDELVDLARKNERSIAGEVRLMIRQHLSDHRSIESREPAERAP